MDYIFASKTSNFSTCFGFYSSKKTTHIDGCINFLKEINLKHSETYPALVKDSGNVISRLDFRLRFPKTRNAISVPNLLDFFLIFINYISP